MSKDLQELIVQLPDTPTEHFCIAPFQSIRQNSLGRNSPCAFGAGEWNHADLNPKERWHSKEVNDLRLKFINGERPSECHRCWAEEDSGKQSLRQRQYEYFPQDYKEFIKSGDWQQGPKTAVFKTSNICNLACRSCGAWDSNSFKDEGMSYIKSYNTKGIHPVTKQPVPWNRFVPIHPAKHINFMDYVTVSDNLEKIDFFGGEPLLNTSQLDFLEYLTEQGVSKNITLFYSTNGTNKPTERLKRAWSKFKRVELSISIDGVEDEFEYLRYPGKWNDLLDVINDLKEFQQLSDNDIYLMAGLTISTMNVLTVDRTYAWLKETIGDVYITMVESPDYLNISKLPKYVKDEIKQQVTNTEALGYLDVNQTDPDAWELFIVWMKRQDQYRKQMFDKVFPDMYNIIKSDWNTITNLEEKH